MQLPNQFNHVNIHPMVMNSEQLNQYGSMSSGASPAMQNPFQF